MSWGTFLWECWQFYQVFGYHRDLRDWGWQLDSQGCSWPGEGIWWCCRLPSCRLGQRQGEDLSAFFGTVDRICRAEVPSSRLLPPTVLPPASDRVLPLWSGHKCAGRCRRPWACWVGRLPNCGYLYFLEAGVQFYIQFVGLIGFEGESEVGV